MPDKQRLRFGNAKTAVTLQYAGMLPRYIAFCNHPQSYFENNSENY